MLAVGPADADDDHAESLPDAGVDQRPAVERRARRDAHLLQIEIEILGGRRQLHEVDHRRPQRRLRELQAADVVRRDHAVGARPQQLRPRIVGLGAADDEQVRPEQARAEDGVDVLGVGADRGDESPRALDAARAAAPLRSRRPPRPPGSPAPSPPACARGRAR